MSPTLTALLTKTFKTETRPLSEPPAIMPRPYRSRSILAKTQAARQVYDRARDLPRLLPLWPAELADDTPEGRKLILAKLQRALRRERRQGITGHWAYDLNRHQSLLRALLHEKSRMMAPQGTRAPMALVPIHPSLAPALYLNVSSRGPSSWPIASERPRSLAPPSDNSAAASTSARY